VSVDHLPTAVLAPEYLGHAQPHRPLFAAGVNIGRLKSGPKS